MPAIKMDGSIYRSLSNINIYDSPVLDRLATQMAQGRYLQVIKADRLANSWEIQLLEDGYGGWLDLQDLHDAKLELSDRQSYLEHLPPILQGAQIRDRLPQIIDFIEQARAVPHEYLWGGTVAPNYDCSGLMQAAFAAVGIWIPRDAYQQEAFGDRIEMTEISKGDLILFGSTVKATHVGIYIGDGKYIHSSGRENGHNGIAESDLQGIDTVSRWYAQQLRGAVRITTSLQFVVPPLRQNS
ncbi:MAG: C40 family peptidase [Pseudanabaenaceae cyanobacterium bins.39]|nr:C40 family peptidase [Pseudanabaenaceae cyanobacterium bins.39]